MTCISSIKAGVHLLLYCSVVICMCFLSTGCLQTSTQEAGEQLTGKTDGMPAKIQSSHLRQGLSVIYFLDKFAHIDDMPKTKQGIAKFGRPGPPIAKLDHRFGNGKIFDSGRDQEVGILMKGYLHLDQVGDYLFQAKSNDGFQLFIHGNLIVSDPGVHGERLSDPGRFTVNQGGVFPVEIKYFQRKGTATIELYWQPPGTGSFSIIPSSAYAH